MRVRRVQATPTEVLFLSILLFGPVAHGLVELWSVTLLHGASILLVTFAILSSIYKGKVQWYRSPLDLLLLLFCAAVLAAAWTSISPHASRLALYELCTYLLLFYYVVNSYQSTRKLGRLLWIFAIFGSIYAVLGLIMRGGTLFGFPIFSRGLYHISLFYVNYNHFANFLELMLWLTLGLALAHHGGKRVLLFGLAIIMAVAVFFSLSRGGIIGLMVGFSFYTAAFALIGEGKKGLWLGLSFALLLLALLFWLGMEPVIARLSTLQDPLMSQRVRLELWKGTFEMFLQRPWLGWGPGTFPIVFPAYQTDMTAGYFINHAHNDYLELAAETGIIGFAAAVLCLLVLFITCLRTLAQSNNTYCQNLGLGALAACISFLAHSVVEFNFHIPANALLFAVAAGIAVAASARSEGRYSLAQAPLWINKTRWTKKGKFFASTVLCGLAAVGLTAVLAPYISTKYLEQVKITEQYYDITALEQALRLDPGNAELMGIMGNIRLAETVSGVNLRPKLLQALHWYEKASAASPTNASYHQQQSTVLERLGRLQEAEEVAQRAVELAPIEPQVHFHSGSFYLRQERVEEAITAYRRFLEVHRNSNDGLKLVLSALSQIDGSYETLEKVVPQTPVFRRLFANELNAQGEKELALQELQRAFALDPVSGTALGYINELIRNKQWTEALTAIEEYIALFPEDARMIDRKAVILENLGQRPEAIAVYRTLLNEGQDYDFTESRRFYNPIHYYIRIAQLYAGQKATEEAVAAIEEGLEHYPHEAQLWYQLGLHLRPTGRVEEGFIALRKAVSLSYTTPLYHYQLGEEYRRNDLQHKAVEVWQNCLKIRPNFSQCAAGIERIEKELGLR